MNEHDHVPGHTTGTAEREGRAVHPPVQIVHLAALAAEVGAERQRRNLEHTAYTVRNAIALRQVLLAFGPEGRMQDHHADGGVAIHVLNGEVVVEVEGAEYPLGQGDLLDLAPGLRHNLHARRESIVLLTIAPVGSVAHPSAPQS
jgi:quercetin dioxygenase-like cupin family protein